MGFLLPDITPRSKIITAMLLVSKTLGKVSSQEVPSLKAKERRICTDRNCPLYKAKTFRYLYGDPVLEEICERHWR